MKRFVAWIRKCRVNARVKAMGPQRFGGTPEHCEQRERLFYGDSIVDWKNLDWFKEKCNPQNGEIR